MTRAISPDGLVGGVLVTAWSYLELYIDHITHPCGDPGVVVAPHACGFFHRFGIQALKNRCYSSHPKIYAGLWGTIGIEFLIISLEDSVIHSYILRLPIFNTSQYTDKRSDLLGALITLLRTRYLEHNYDYGPTSSLTLDQCIVFVVYITLRWFSFRRD